MKHESGISWEVLKNLKSTQFKIKKLKLKQSEFEKLKGRFTGFFTPEENERESSKRKKSPKKIKDDQELQEDKMVEENEFVVMNPKKVDFKGIYDSEQL